MSIITEVVDLDEKLAKDLLGQNTGNRPFKQEAIARYARDLLAQRWILNGEAIKVSANGRLLDGQNRCAAVIRANAERDPSTPEITMPVLMIWGVEDRAQDVMDIGVKRSVSDQLQRRGRKYSATVAASAKLVLLYESQCLFSRDLTTNSEILGFIAEHPELEEYSGTVYHMNYRAGALLISSAVVAAMYLVQRSTTDSDEAQLFFEQLVQGTALNPGSPMLALRQRMIQARLNRERVDNKMQLNLILRVWNAHRTGQTMLKLPIVTRGKALQVKKVET